MKPRPPHTPRTARTRPFRIAASLGLLVAASLVVSLASCAPTPSEPPPVNGGGPGPDPDPGPDPGPPPGPGVWRSATPLPSARQEVAAAFVGGRMMVGGGSNDGHGGHTGAHDAFDPVTGEWQPRAALPQAADHVQAVELDGLVYYVGGLTSWPSGHTGTVSIYDPVADAFGSGTPMDRPRGAGGAAVHDGKIYYAGGLASGAAVPWFDVYDPVAGVGGSWAALPDMPVARDHFHAAVVDGVLYAIGGRDSGLAQWPTITQVDAFDFGTGTWTTLDTELPTPRGGFAAAVLGREILIIGGESTVAGAGDVHDEVEAYDTVEGTWRTLQPMPTARHGIQAAVCGGEVFVAGGGAAYGGGGPTAVHEVFAFEGADPCPGPPITFSDVDWSVVPFAPERTTEAQGAAVGDTLYVFGGYSSFSPFCVSDRARAYDAATSQWRELATPFPVAWTHAGVAVDGALLHMAGGRELSDPCEPGTGLDQESGTTAIWTFDTTTETWSSYLPPLPEPRSAGDLVRLGRHLHYFGGTGSDAYDDRPDHWALDLDGDDGWVERAPLPVARNHIGAAALGGFAYAIGGQVGSMGTGPYLTVVHRYDPEADAWSEVAPLPAAVSHVTSSTFVVGERIVVLGGERQHDQNVADVVAYDPETDTWSELDPMPQARRAVVAGLVAGRIVVDASSLQEQETFIGTFIP